MRRIERIFVHCTAGSQKATVKEVLAEFRRKGWQNPGYHYLITADGSCHRLLGEEHASNGVKGYNSTSINIAYTGGVDERLRSTDNRTDAQKAGLLQLLKELRGRYPKAVIMGHRDISPDKNKNGIIDPWERIKECPCFDAKDEYKNI
ncbi:N-acetylmuramoyl-L-alanine amidase [Palleniella muris]|uniref:N-acetylmuramoyl-L-alanine amidase n=1 Tax=Palleniella muris TaxID=3038145 RepID=A0AC61QRR3_9BACT|nr:N-acetylmuramoyl-L-alanine amidase [Palleniella muris]TGX82982.1 N-acetylmuramoyl-L-alanine amidase [Palleniella muris]